MEADIWPLFGLRLRSGAMVMRVPQDDDLPGLIALARQGIHDPSEMPFAVPWTDVPSPQFERSFVQYHWAGRATLSPLSWALPFLVEVDGEVVGVQDLRAENFPVLGCVETGSWLVRSRQGRGLGTRMREMGLAFTFDHLGAVYTQSAAFIDNPASQAVSRKLGYFENGTKRHVRRGRPVLQIRFQMEREQWLARERPRIEVTGFDACRELLGAPLSDR